jgi:hypothetical protein
MRRLPIILALLSAAFLIVCDLEYGLRGLNADVESDWVVHARWWQSDLLADCGLSLRLLAVIALTPFERFIGESGQVAFVFVLLVELLTVVVAFFLVLYSAKLLVRFLRPNRAMQRTTPNSDA